MRALRFIVESMGEMPGRKSLVFFSDSLPIEEQDFTSTFSPSEESVGAASLISADNRNFGAMLYRIAEKAIRSSVVIYTIDAGGLQYTGLTAADNLSNVAIPEFKDRANQVMRTRALQIQQTDDRFGAPFDGSGMTDMGTPRAKLPPLKRTPARITRPASGT